MEDGFLRSVGLGSDFTRPASLVLDRQGIYYDPRFPSDLENILQSAVFSTEELGPRARGSRADRGAADQQYNACRGRELGGASAASGEKLCVFVPGQVEDDASIRFGCRDVRTNEGLLRAVRARRPEAYILYKPHPDVVSGNRRGRVPKATLRKTCDQVTEEVDIASCLGWADEVHTMTSLVGFEALLRRVPVTAYGLPFYAGWGLTEDRHAAARRKRRLTVDELVAGALIRYPRYLDPSTGGLTTPEAIAEYLADARDRAGPTRVREPRILRQARRLGNIVRGALSVR